MVWYLETSAFLKLVVDEEHSPAMRRWFTDHPPCWSSQLLVTEALRAAVRLGIDPELVGQALDTVSLILPTASTFLAAATIDPPTLRSLDAVHLATALELGSDLLGVVTYDDRLLEGAAAASLSAVSP